MKKALILPASTEDAHTLASLINTSYRGDEAKHSWTNEASLLTGTRTSQEDLVELLSDPRSIILKVVKENEIIACVHLETQLPDIHLNLLTVHPRYQNKGLGKILLKAAEGYAFQQNACSIHLQVISERTELINWYKKQGFQIIGELQPFPTHTINGIPLKPLQLASMRKMLTNE